MALTQASNDLWKMPENHEKRRFPGLRAVMIDNYDSFTYNLVQYLQELEIGVTTRRNDMDTEATLGQIPGDFFVISPGPSIPDRAGISLALIDHCAKTATPLFGVCLGHQCIGQYFGGVVQKIAEPMHGKISPIKHNAKGVFANVKNPLTATRYHSLIVERGTIPPCLTITAEGPQGEVMGLQHTDLPIAGVQFHPESVLTEYGHTMLANFVEQVAKKS